MSKRRLVPVALLFLLTVLADPAAAAPPALQRVIPIWAGIGHGNPVAGGVVVARSRDGRLLAPPGRTGRNGAASLLASRRLPGTFVVEVRRGVEPGASGRATGAPILRATVRDWKRPRVVYVDPFSTIVSSYGSLHPRLAAEKATRRVQRQLGIGTGLDFADSATFWSDRVFSGSRFARAARRHGGIVRFSGQVARRVDDSRHLDRFPPGIRKGGEGSGGGKGKGTRGGPSRRPALAETSVSSSALTTLAQRQQLENELIDAAKTAIATASGSPSALVQFGQLMDTLLGGGDTSDLKQIADQLESIQTGVKSLEHEVSQLGEEVSLDGYTTAVDSYETTQDNINAAWELYVHAAACAAEGNETKARKELEGLEAEFSKSWGNAITSTTAVPYDQGRPGLMSWAQNAKAKGLDGGSMTAANQGVSRGAGFVWWVYWLKDLILHTEMWDNPRIDSGIAERTAITRETEALEGLERASEDEYGNDLPPSLVYAIGPGKLYSVGTVWNIAPSVAPPQTARVSWGQMTRQEAEALPSESEGFMEALVESVPEYPQNPNASMKGIFGAQPNNGTWPTFYGTGGGYGIPPNGTESFGLKPSPGEECYGQWSWLTNGQGSNNTTGAPIIRLCPALIAGTGKVAGKGVCTQVDEHGQFFGWSNDFPLADWSGLWRHEKAIEFVTCNDVDKWQNAGDEYEGLNWGTGIFEGDSPLSTALDISHQPSAYYSLWTRPVTPQDGFLTGPVTTSG